VGQDKDKSEYVKHFIGTLHEHGKIEDAKDILKITSKRETWIPGNNIAYINLVRHN
jgi:hypothetical protein